MGFCLSHADGGAAAAAADDDDDEDDDVSGCTEKRSVKRDVRFNRWLMQHTDPSTKKDCRPTEVSWRFAGRLLDLHFLLALLLRQSCQGCR